MSDLLFGTDLLSELDRLQRQMVTLFAGAPASLRTARPGTFPPVNIGSTDDSVETVAFAPRLDPAQIDASIDKGLLTISGERKRPDFETTDDIRAHTDECSTGAFRHVTELLQDVDPDKVNVRYTNGCLTTSVGKPEASKSRQITVQG